MWTNVSLRFDKRLYHQFLFFYNSLAVERYSTQKVSFTSSTKLNPVGSYVKMFNFTSAELLEDARETRVLRVWQICLPLWQYKLYRHQNFTVTSRRTFLNMIPLPMLFTDADGRFKLFPGQWQGSQGNHGGPAGTCRTQRLAASSHTDYWGSHTWAPVAQQAAPPGLETVAPRSP